MGTRTSVKCRVSSVKALSNIMKSPSQKQTVHSGRYLRLVIRDGWEYIERVNCTGVVIIVAKNKANQVILVEQFRPPVGKRVIGFPAGLVNDHVHRRKESAAAAARRVFREETGYLAGKITKFFAGPVSAGMSPDMVTIFHADKLKKVGQGGGDECEDITVHEVPLRTIDAWLARQRKKGVLVAPNVYAGIYFLKHWAKLRCST
jgi:ADP-ribose pyrophosphatase